MRVLLIGLLSLIINQVIAQERPALIPEPVYCTYDSGMFELGSTITYSLKDPALQSEWEYLKAALAKQGWQGQWKMVQANPRFEIAINPTAMEPEAYVLRITQEKISLTGGSAHGVFNGIQTLLQSVQDFRLQSVTIRDQPAFSFRGFMIDVGRNFQSLPLIRQQIDMMAALKLNVFHFHLTEDIAWRIESKKYPALNDSTHMTRNPGQYYRFAEIRALVDYCRARHIQLIPEIDMPGHSAAFTRALGVDMQTTEGKRMLRELLDEFMQEVKVESIHIGGDEVKYKDPDFLKEMATHLMQNGKKILSWDPGGATLPGTIHQLWQGSKKPPVDRPSIDSRHLYLNHLDPLEGVSSTFNHRILDSDKGDAMKLGATLCNWPDRKVRREEDLIGMNAVLPVMTAFAERCWKGGGFYNYGSDIGKPKSASYVTFSAFEERMIRWRNSWFPQASFPYVRQAGIEWSLIGPYPNQGDLLRSFPPETSAFWDTASLSKCPSVYGGTIWLRHFWHPMIRSHLSNPTDSATWYAYRKFHVDTAGWYPFWIGFKNISRSVQAATPPKGKWDERESRLWVNGNVIPAPDWKFPGRIPKSLEEPLVDEGYEYRPPTLIMLKKGWNEVLIKLPAGNFKGPWYDPVKWMFTFVRL